MQCQIWMRQNKRYKKYKKSICDTFLKSQKKQVQLRKQKMNSATITSLPYILEIINFPLKFKSPVHCGWKSEFRYLLINDSDQKSDKIIVKYIKSNSRPIFHIPSNYAPKNNWFSNTSKMPHTLQTFQPRISFFGSQWRGTL